MEFVRYPQTDHPFVHNSVREAALQVVPMLYLHDEYPVSPAEQTGRHPLARTELGPGRPGDHAGKTVVEMFRRTAAPLIATANEKQLQGPVAAVGSFTHRL